jgi:hypothetical protein
MNYPALNNDLQSIYYLHTSFASIFFQNTDPHLDLPGDLIHEKAESKRKKLQGMQLDLGK